MLKGYGRTGDIGAAELMFELMASDRDQKPDVVALNSLLDACVRNGDLRRAVEVLEQVTARVTPPVDFLGVRSLDSAHVYGGSCLVVGGFAL